VIVRAAEFLLQADLFSRLWFYNERHLSQFEVVTVAWPNAGNRCCD
jgi:hypothetical protein